MVILIKYTALIILALSLVLLVGLASLMGTTTGFAFIVVASSAFGIYGACCNRQGYGEGLVAGIRAVTDSKGDRL